MPDEFLAHPAYADRGFPIYWQNLHGWPEGPRPPAYVRYSHHPATADLGYSIVSCFSRGKQTNVEALRDAVLSAYDLGGLGAGVVLTQVDHMRAFPTGGVFHLPIHLNRKVNPGREDNRSAS